MVTTMEQKPKTELKLERQTCGRCGGSGKYSYCQMYGDRCFQCGGSGVVLTKRGAAAANYLRSLRTVPASDVKVGDEIIDSGFRYTVEQVTTTIQRGSSLVDGVMTPYEMPIINLHTKRCLFQKPGDGSVELFLDADRRRANLVAAIDYQNSLTKAGKPRKRAQ